MSDSALGLLYVDDEADNLSLFRFQFGKQFRVLTAPDAATALAMLSREEVGMVATDERMPGMTGIELLARVAEHWPDVSRMIVSAYGDAERLLRAINQGHAQEYVLKPWKKEELQDCLERGLASAQRKKALQAQAAVALALADDVRRERDPSVLAGATSGLEAALRAAERAARSDATVLIRGETGTGKELMARFIHEHSNRASGPFIRVNCAALSEGLLESELFGHEQGAFTGASRTRKGRFELADGGTLFLDEVGDISPRLQVLLLRVLQEREIERVGGTATLPVDVRVLAATHQPLEQRVQAQTFREDLYYRLNVIPLVVPPLRERPNDIPALIRHFIVKHAPPGARPSVAPEALEALSRYTWPGNVRELENVVQRAVVLGACDVLQLEDFCLQLSIPPLPELRKQAHDDEALQTREVLLAHGGNVARAARALAIPRTTFISRAKKHGLM